MYIIEGISDSCPVLGWLLHWEPGGGGCICSLDRGRAGRAQGRSRCAGNWENRECGAAKLLLLPTAVFVSKGLHAFQFDIPELKKFCLHFTRPLMFECMGKKEIYFESNGSSYYCTSRYHSRSPQRVSTAHPAGRGR